MDCAVSSSTSTWLPPYRGCGANARGESTGSEKELATRPPPKPDGDVCNGDDACDGLGTCQPGEPLVCDDGDACTQDSCDPLAGCENPAEPATTCLDGFEKGSLLIHETVSGKEKLVAKLSKGPALAQLDFGNPLDPGGTAYTACLYDDASALVGSLEVDRAGEPCGTRDCWRPLGPPPFGKGFVYGDKDASADGVTQIKLLGGAAGKSSVQVKGANNASKGQLDLPVGLAAGLVSSASATIQLFGSDAPECLSITLDEVEKQTADRFQAIK